MKNFAVFLMPSEKMLFGSHPRCFLARAASRHERMTSPASAGPLYDVPVFFCPSMTFLISEKREFTSVSFPVPMLNILWGGKDA